MPMPMPMPIGPPPPPGMAMPMQMGGMSFTWGHRAVVLFPRWLGDRSGVGMFILCLLVVLALAALVEALSATSSRSRGRPGQLPAALLAAGVHAAKVGLAYLVMLAVMFFNVGVLLARSGLLGPRAAAATSKP